MTVTKYVAAGWAIGLAAWTLGGGVAAAVPPHVAAAPTAVVAPPSGIGWSFDWDDDDDDWENPATWECPAGCSIVWEDNY
jgi:hypothetical protein